MIERTNQSLDSQLQSGEQREDFFDMVYKVPVEVQADAGLSGTLLKYFGSGAFVVAGIGISLFTYIGAKIGNSFAGYDNIELSEHPYFSVIFTFTIAGVAMGVVDYVDQRKKQKQVMGNNND